MPKLIMSKERESEFLEEVLRRKDESRKRRKGAQDEEKSNDDDMRDEGMEAESGKKASPGTEPGAGASSSGAAVSSSTDPTSSCTVGSSTAVVPSPSVPKRTLRAGITSGGRACRAASRGTPRSMTSRPKRVRLQTLGWEVCSPGVRWADMCDVESESRGQMNGVSDHASAGMSDTLRGRKPHLGCLPAHVHVSKGALDAKGT